jgi:seryl-tRNA(Sec) selenium transferase
MKQTALLEHRAIQAGLMVKRKMVGEHLEKRARESKSYEALLSEKSTLTDLLLSMKLFLRKEEASEDITRFKLLRERVDKCAQGVQVLHVRRVLFTIKLLHKCFELLCSLLMP